jgi:UDP-N-acetyl-D-glucosamine dehydrogenase
MPFQPGPGMGGHCLPVDPFYLTWKAREYDIATEFIELAGKVNQTMPYFCLEKIERALNDAGRAVRDARVHLLGVAYKAGVGDMRESPALKIGSLLQDLGADLVYHDDFVPEVAELGLRSSSLDAAVDGADVVVIVTAHPGIDFDALAAQALVIDFRGVTRGGDAPAIRL